MYSIMVVDDDSTSLAICKALLGSQYKMILMKSGLQALGYLAENKRPDLILLDMIMPGMNGIEMLKTIKKNEDKDWNEIPVIFISSVDNDQIGYEIYLNGADDFVKKPVMPEILKFKIKRHLDLKEIKKENSLLKNKLMKISLICQEFGK